MSCHKTFVLLTLSASLAGVAHAANVSLPDSGQTTALSASVNEQARVTVPGSAGFNVTNVLLATSSGSLAVCADTIVLTDGRKMKISLGSGSASFTLPCGTETFSVGDVTWNIATWTNGIGTTGTLSNTSFTEVASSVANAGSLCTLNLVFTLAPNSRIHCAGTFTIVVTWKFESF